MSTESRDVTAAPASAPARTGASSGAVVNGLQVDAVEASGLGARLYDVVKTADDNVRVTCQREGLSNLPETFSP